MFSKSTEYALRASIFIALKASSQRKVSIQEIAEGIGAPQAFTAKVLQQLTKKSGGIIASVPGPSGGFYMTEEAKRKSVYDIIFAMKESNVIESCVLGFPQCSDENPCSLHYEYKELKIRLISLFKGKTIYDLAKTSKKLIPVNEQRN